MKKIILPLFLGVLIACEDDETVYSVAPELSPYVDVFYSEAAKRGHYLDDRINVELKDFGFSRNPENYAEFNRIGGMRITVNSRHFNEMDDQRREALMFFYLGRCVLGRPEGRGSDFKSFMNQDSFRFGYEYELREQMIDEIFTCNDPHNRWCRSNS